SGGEAVQAERDDAGADPQPAAVFAQSLPDQPGPSDLEQRGDDEQGDRAGDDHDGDAFGEINRATAAAGETAGSGEAGAPDSSVTRPTSAWPRVPSRFQAEAYGAVAGLGTVRAADGYYEVKAVFAALCPAGAVARGRQRAHRDGHEGHVGLTRSRSRPRTVST